MTIVNNLRVWLARLEVEKQRSISARELAKQTGVSRSTVNLYLNNKAERVRLRDCLAIIEWFHGHGFYYTMSDLFELRGGNGLQEIADEAIKQLKKGQTENDQ